MIFAGIVLLLLAIGGWYADEVMTDEQAEKILKKF